MVRFLPFGLLQKHDENCEKVLRCSWNRPRIDSLEEFQSKVNEIVSLFKHPCEDKIIYCYSKYPRYILMK
jgi:hypothetical protein